MIPYVDTIFVFLNIIIFCNTWWLMWSMATTKGFGEILALFHKALAKTLTETLTGAFQNLKFQRAPATKLRTIYGRRRREWLENG